MTEKQGLCGTLSEASHPRGLKQLSMWENAKNRPTEQAPKGGIGGKAEKRPFFIPHITAKINVHVGTRRTICWTAVKTQGFNYSGIILDMDTHVLQD